MARKAEEFGVDAINTDIGWHEAQVPTIVTSVPRGAFVKFTERLRDEVSIPLIAANRINTAEFAEEILGNGRVDAIQMARPFLADPPPGQQGPRGTRRRDQHLHRLQPGLPRPRLRRQEGVVPGESACGT